MAPLEQSFTRFKLELCHFWGNLMTGGGFVPRLLHCDVPQGCDVWPFAIYKIYWNPPPKKVYFSRIQTVTVSVCLGPVFKASKVVASVGKGLKANEE